MAKDSRPDIQVLEDRIVRLKSQLLEYKKMRLYSSTKRRLSAVAKELSECISIIDSITNNNSNVISASSLSAITECDVLNIPEFTENDDLLDNFLLATPIGDDLQHRSTYSPKEIVSTYCKRLKEGSSTEGNVSGVLQVNQFWKLLNSWYQARFTPAIRDPKFRFKSDKIHEWIDLLMIAAGRALHEKMFPLFVQQVYGWVNKLNGPDGELWVLPYSVMQYHTLESSFCTPEAVLFECMIKPFLYDASFYPNELHSVRNIVMTNGGYTAADLDLETIISNSTSIFCTSCFDIKKYKEVI